VRVGITPSGLELLRQLDEPMLALHRSQFAPLGASRVATLTRLLRRLLAS
jgi:DNA-binding MarR family transcriptional regulator